jgi:hypothetical protein
MILLCSFILLMLFAGTVSAPIKGDLPPPYPGELINALHKTTQHARMNNSSSVIPILSHAQLPHSVRLIGAETGPLISSGDP